MDAFAGKVAVVTGAASGIGLALATRFAQEGMRVVMADRDVDALTPAAATLQERGASILSVEVEVSQARDIEALAEATKQRFGAVDLLCNNAGVGIATPILAGTVEDWEWALGVNLWSVIHGVRVFVPIMRAQQTSCHIINTASIAGLISPPGLGIYRTTKHAVVAFSEALYHELAANAPQIGISVLVPGVVKTGIMRSARRSGETVADPQEEQRLQHALEAAMPPEAVAELTLEAVRARRFYILTHPERNWQIRTRMEDILLSRNPSTGVNPANG